MHQKEIVILLLTTVWLLRGVKKVLEEASPVLGVDALVDNANDEYEVCDVIA